MESPLEWRSMDRYMSREMLLGHPSSLKPATEEEEEARELKEAREKAWPGLLLPPGVK